MINKVPSFQTSSGKICGTLQEAQFEELLVLLNASDGNTEVVETLLEQAEKVIDILTTTETSLPKARKLNGGKKTRKVKVLAAAASNEAKADAIEAASQPETFKALTKLVNETIVANEPVTT